MKLYRFMLLLFVGIIINTGINSFSQSKNIHFDPPVRFPIYLSSNFGEIRPDHFHSGIDIKTQGTVGKKIYAVDDGYISRIKVSISGFGKAVYIRHFNGYTSVYAHLSRFADTVADYIIRQQYIQKSYVIDIYPKPDEFIVRKDDLIGYSGNTGNSFGPHLHFEIRETQSESPVNPLFFHFPIKDTIPPVIYRLYVYPEGTNTVVNNHNEKRLFTVEQINGIYRLSQDTLLHVTGPFSLGLEAQDYMNGSHSRCGIYSFKLLIDNKMFFYYTMDEFSYRETRYINSYIDYAEKIKDDRNVIRTVILPNNKLDIYKEVLDHGIIRFPDNHIHKLDIIVSDAYGNTSLLTLYVIRTENPVVLKQSRKKQHYLTTMPYDRDNYYSFDGFWMYIPKMALYDTLYFTMQIKPALKNSYSAVYQIQNRYVPVHLPYTVWITPDHYPEEHADKLLLAEVNDPDHPNATGGDWNGKDVTGELEQFGEYTIMIDTTPPEIIPVFTAGEEDFRDYKTIRFKIKDNLSGIASYNGFIDDNWVLFEYEPKEDLLFYRFDKKRLRDHRQHHLLLRITDEKDNMTVYEKDFYW